MNIGLLVPSTFCLRQLSLAYVAIYNIIVSIAFKIPIHFGHGLMYYKFRWKVGKGLLTAGFSSSSPLIQRTAVHCVFCESTTPK